MTHEEFFNWMREQQDPKRLSQEMVGGANELLALLTAEELKASLSKINNWSDKEDSVKTLKFSEKALTELGILEGFRSAPYKDIAGVWTIGYGNTYYPNRKPVTASDKHLTKQKALKLKTDIINLDFAPAVNILFADEIESGFLNQNMFDALVSLAYNIGTRGLAGSTVTKKIKAKDKLGAANAILSWNKAKINGVRQPIKGLIIRREKERKLFLA